MPRKILYISVHAVLEYDELKLFTQLGHSCFSLGSYTHPEGHFSLPRPGIPDMLPQPKLINMVQNMPKTEIKEELLDHFDTVVLMGGFHDYPILKGNWEKFKRKGIKVIWRTIGQTTTSDEHRMRRFRNEGLKIVRYSPMEEKISGYCGGDAVIRFYKDPNEFKDWTGHVLQVINLSQSIKARRDFCGYDMVMKVAPGFPFKVYGTGNEDLGEYNGGFMTYEAMKGALRDCRVYFYAGTWPAPYTLGFMEAMMTGTPIVSVDIGTWRHKDHLGMNVFEIPKIIQNGVNGYFSDNPEELRGYIQKLLDDPAHALQISQAGRQRAIDLFGEDTVADQWRDFFNSL